MDTIASGAQALQPTPPAEGVSQVAETSQPAPIAENSTPTPPPIVEGASPPANAVDSVQAPGEHTALFEPMMPPPPPTPMAAETVTVPQPDSKSTPAIPIAGATPTAQDQLNRPTLETPPIKTEADVNPVSPEQTTPPVPTLPAAQVTAETVAPLAPVDAITSQTASVEEPLVPTEETKTPEPTPEPPVAVQPPPVEVPVLAPVAPAVLSEEKKIDLTSVLTAQQQALQETPTGNEKSLVDQVSPGPSDEEVTVAPVKPLPNARALEAVNDDLADEAVEGVIGSRS